MDKINMPAGAEYIIEQLNKHGFEAYIVGGCVRDSLLGKVPNDWDITTSATPYEVKKIFRKTIDTGIQHGTVTVMVDKKYIANYESVSDTEQMSERVSVGDTEHMSERVSVGDTEHMSGRASVGDTEQSSGHAPNQATKPAEKKINHYDYAFEVTTYRVDGEYEDHRRPTEVTFTACLEEDLKRRDFTINAMAYNHEKGVVDIFGGQQDLVDGIIRAVGVAEERFTEDALRILRAVRFAAQLGFDIEEETKKAMTKLADSLRFISAERIQVELTKLITSKHPDRLVEAYNLGLTKVVLPEFDVMMETEQDNPHHLYNVGIHTIKVMEHVPPTPILRYTALLHDVGKPKTKTFDDNGIGHFYAHQAVGADMARDILKRLKLDNHTIDEVCLLIKEHDFSLHGTNIKAFRRFLNRIGKERFQDFLTIKRADMAGQSDYNKELREGYVKDMIAMFEQISDEKHCIKMSEMAIRGQDLIEMGISPGKEMGNILKALFEKVLDDPCLNDIEILKKMVEEKRY
ncbi:MAG: HD domain-containing protein [Lachnospiraceae bacterium]|nr:HD domain-containing protein [Lachnospiraceae bacterium]